MSSSTRQRWQTDFSKAHPSLVLDFRYLWGGGSPKKMVPKNQDFWKGGEGALNSPVWSRPTHLVVLRHRVNENPNFNNWISTLISFLFSVCWWSSWEVAEVIPVLTSVAVITTTATIANEISVSVLSILFSYISTYIHLSSSAWL